MQLVTLRTEISESVHLHPIADRVLCKISGPCIFSVLTLLRKEDFEIEIMIPVCILRECIPKLCLYSLLHSQNVTVISVIVGE